MNLKIRRLENGLFVMKDDTHLSRWVEEEGRLDHARFFLEQFRPLIPLGGTVIDCGTSIGDHTVTYSSWVGPEGKVIGFEANPDVAECASLNLGIYEWARIFNIGLSDSYGSGEMEVNPNVGASRLNANAGSSIKTAPLDSFIGSLDRCDFIKVDIEGWELKMLNGATELIKRFRPSILMEINSAALAAQGASPKAVFDKLDSIGYAYRVVDGAEGSGQYEILAQAK